MYSTEWAPDPVSMVGASPARVCDALRGGLRGFATDRTVVGELLAAAPEAAYWARADRGFLDRAVRHLLRRGVSQFIDLGCGLAGVEGLRAIVGTAGAGVRLLSVDLDPMVSASVRQWVRADPRVVVVCADLRQPERIVADPAVTEVLDLSRPVGLLAVGVLHLVPADSDLGAALARWAGLLPAGSHLVVSHLSPPRGPVAPGLVRALRIYSERVAPVMVRSRGQVSALLERWRPVEPGLCPVAFWHPNPALFDDPGELARAERIPLVAGVAVNR